MTDLTLTNDFPPATRDEWLRRVEGVLKGADFKRKLVGRTYDGIDIQPLYEKAEDAQPVIRGETGAVAHLPAARPSGSRHRERAGARRSRRRRRCADAGRPRRRRRRGASGLRSTSLDDLDRALADVMLDLIHVRLDAGGHGRQVGGPVRRARRTARPCAVGALGRSRARSPRRDGGHGQAFGLLGRGRRRGWPKRRRTSPARGFGGRIFLSDGRPYQEAGASEAQELAAVLATGIAYLRALEAGGVPLDAARDTPRVPARGGCGRVSHRGEIPRPAPPLGPRRAGLRPCSRSPSASMPRRRGG